MPKAGLYSGQLNGIGPGLLQSADPLKLNIGCGDTRMPGYVNCDLYQTEYADVSFDCQGTWPFPDHSVSAIYSSHMLEHLTNFKEFFKEAHRVLRPDGHLQIRVPYGGHRAAWWDPEHVRPWYAETFCFLQPGFSKSIRNPQHLGWQHHFSVDDCILRVEEQLAPLLRWRWLRRRILPWLHMLPEAVVELWVWLTPLKGEQAVADWMALHQGNAICSRFAMYEHQIEKRKLADMEPMRFTDWREDH